jgi:hypothetical protein
MIAETIGLRVHDDDLNAMTFEIESDGIRIGAPNRTGGLHDYRAGTCEF